MSDQDINFRLNTEGNPEGADTVAKSLAALEAAVQTARAASAAAGDDEATAARRLEYETGKVLAVQQQVAATGFGGMNAAAKDFNNTIETTSASNVKSLEDVKTAFKRTGDAAEEARKKAEQDTGDTGEAKTKSQLDVRLIGVTGKVATLLAEAKALAGPVTFVYKTMTTVFGGVKGQLDEMGKAYPDFIEKNKNLAIVINGLANPMQLVKDTWTGVSGYILERFDAIALGGAIASVKSAVAAKEMADKMKAAYEAAAAAHTKMLQSMEANNVSTLLRQQAADARLLVTELENAQKIADAQAALASGRAQRAGEGAGTQAVAGLGNAIQSDTTAMELAKAAVSEANRVYSNAIGEAFKFKESDSSAAAESARAAAENAQTALTLAQGNLATLAQTQTATLTNKAEAAAATVTSDFEAKQTAVAEKLKSELEAVQAKEGAKTSAVIVQTLADVKTLLADGKITLEETNSLQGEILSFKQSNAANTQAQQKMLQDLIEISNSNFKAFQNEQNQITALKNQMADFLNRQTAGGRY